MIFSRLPCRYILGIMWLLEDLSEPCEADCGGVDFRGLT